MKNKTKMPFKCGMGFLASNFGGTWVQLVVTTYFAYFLTDIVVFPVAIVTGITMMARITDVIMAPLAGGIIQRSNTKMGQYRPWLLIPPFFAILGGGICFLKLSIPVGAAAIIYGVGYLLNQVPQSFNLVSLYGLIPKIAGSNMNDRTLASSRIMQGYYLGNFITGLILVPLISYFAFLGEGPNYMLIAAVFAAVNALVQIPMFRVAKPYDRYNPNLVEGSGNKLKFSEVLKTAVKSRALMMIFISECFRYGMWTYVASMMVYYFDYSSGKPAAMAIALPIGSFVGFASVLIAPKLIGTAGKKKVYNISNVLCAIVYLIMAMFGKGNPMVFIVTYTLGIFITSFADAMGPNLYLDAAEAELHKSGKDIRAFAASLTNLSIKMSLVLVSLFMGIGLGAIGYVGGAETTPLLATQMSWLTGGITALFAVICLILMLFYNLTDEQAAEYAKENEEKYGAMEE